MSFARGRTYAGVTAFVVTGLILATLLHLPTTIFAGQPAKEDAKQAIASVLASAVQVSAGDDHTCALTTSGGVKCWGHNEYGQLGDGTTLDKATPVDVIGLSSGVSAISAGGDHTCALTTSGGMKCWGGNYYGQLGDGTTINRNSATDVIGLDINAKTVSSGGNHTCILTTNGGVKCWGDNNSGQLGNGTNINENAPVNVQGLADGVMSVDAGTYYTCALLISSGVKCWGENFYGQLGDGTTEDKNVPVDVVDLINGASSISTGYLHTCVGMVIGGIKCWGNNIFGQLGDGTNTSKKTPVNVIGINDHIILSTLGIHHTCVLLASEKMKCWGNNVYGQLGNGTYLSTNIPAEALDLGNNVRSGSTMNNHSCAVLTDGKIKCWGANYFGQLGDGTSANKNFPADVSNFGSEAKMISTGEYHTCAITASNGVKCWGNNSSGQLGDNSNTTNNIPVDVHNIESVNHSVYTGGDHSCSLTASGGVNCWGENSSGQLGDGTTVGKSTPVAVVGVNNAANMVSTGVYHTCAVTTNNGVKCWGSNGYGQLGNGERTIRITPVDVLGLGEGVNSVSAGLSHTCALTLNGGVECWGSNFYGQLGDGTTADKSTPVNVVGLSSGVTAISVGHNFTCALITNGGVKCWGANDVGQLGDGTTSNKNIPVDVIDLLNGANAISAGGGHTCALTISGGVKCWGNNFYGQLGDGTNTGRNTPVDVLGLSGNMREISAGGNHTCALTIAGGVKCWGSNFYGQLGDGTSWRNTPIQVGGFEGGIPTSTPTPTSIPGLGDVYEPDDFCASARAIATDGTIQQHTFHQQGDTDWVSFSASAGAHYIIEGDAPPSSPADVSLEVYGQCGGLPLGSQNYAFSPGVRLDFTAPSNGAVYLKLQNSSGSVFGPNVEYHLSVRNLSAQPPVGAAIIVAGRYRDGDPLQANIHNVTNDVYAMFAHHGYDSSRIRYLATNLGMAGVNALPSRDNLRAAITQWALDKVDVSHALTIYLMDHGGNESFYLDREHGEVLTPSDLNAWLSELETARPGVKINIIVEACYSGSFITQPGSISKPGRVVIASTNASNYAWASNIGGAWFSDIFLMGLDRNQTLFDAFSSARSAVQNAFVFQTPWLDDNGDGQFTAADGPEAQKRGFAYAGTFGDDNWPPYIASATVSTTGQTGERQITAHVLDDAAVQFVWAVIYPPSYQPPPTSDELVNENLQTVVLLRQPDGTYGASYPGFTELGSYRVVVFAQDNQGANAQPASMRVNNGGRAFLPFLTH